MNQVIIKFVKQKGCSFSPEMSMAYDQTKSKYNLNPEWIYEEECLKLNKTTILKTNVFVFEEFSGVAFDHLLDSEALLIGTRCLLYCLSRKKELPTSLYPLYTLSMAGFFVTASGFNPEEKEKIKTYIQWMGGVYHNNLHENTTHLISNNVTSIKYSKAAGRIPIMHSKWVDAVWNESKSDKVNGDCSNFLEMSIETCRLPPFYGLNITSASLSPPERDRVKNCVERNGGVFMGKYTFESTDVLVVELNGIDSAKYKAAYQANKEIVKPSWVFASEAKRYAVPMDEHRLMDYSQQNNKSNINLSNHGNSTKNQFEMTVGLSSDVTLQEQSVDIKSLFNLKSVRNAGLFLDGCGIYIAGFTLEDREFLYRVLNSGGATRYDEASERVSHVIAANNNIDIKLLFENHNLTPFFVNLNWLVESVQQGEIVSEDNYIIKFLGDTLSATKKKENVQPVIDKSFYSKSDTTDDIENHVMQMYKSNDITNATIVKETDFSKSSRYNYFSNCNIFLSEDFPDSQLEELSAHITDAGGSNVNSIDIANYIIVPEKLNKNVKEPDFQNIVTPLYIKSCLEQRNKARIEYFHKPIIMGEKKPLKNLVFSISSYSGYERYYIAELCRELGAICMDTFIRRSQPEKGLQGATHLICKEANGAKYKACIAWGLPAVGVEWLLECYATRTRVLETPYLVGDTKAPKRTISDMDNEETLIQSTSRLCLKRKVFEEYKMSTSNIKEVPDGILDITKTESGNISESECKPSKRWCDGLSPPVSKQSSSLIEEDKEQSPVRKQPVLINTQLEKLNELLTSGLGKITPSKATTPFARKHSISNIETLYYDTTTNESEAESVGWRDPSELSLSVDKFREILPFRKRPPVFLLSGVSNKSAVTKTILDLGGKVCDTSSNEYDPKCSHILCDQPSRSEKLLAGMSAGKWILSTNYIVHCSQEKRFLEEEQFEWGNPAGDYCSSNSVQEGAAYYRWRCKLNNSLAENKSKGAFSNWKVVLRLDKKQSFARVISAGFGQIVESDDIELLKEGSVTHCFCEPRKNLLSTDDIRHLIRIGAFVLPVQYLNKYLLDSPTPNPKLFLITV